MDAVVLDIDGVLIRHRRALPGAVELLSWLREQDLPFTLLTNDGCTGPQEKAAYLRSGGIDVEADRICSVGHAIPALVESLGVAGQRFFALGRLGEPDYAVAAGLVVTRDLRELVGGRCQGLIVGETGYEWEPAVNAAINFLIQKPGAPLVCPNPDLYFPVRDHGIRLASGAVTLLIREMVERYGIACAPIYLGKPYEPVFAVNHARLEARAGGVLSRDRVLMVGDTLGGDIAGARAFGYRTALVLTGLTRLDMLDGSAVQPDLVARGL